MQIDTSPVMGIEYSFCFGVCIQDDQDLAVCTAGFDGQYRLHKVQLSSGQLAATLCW